MAQDGWRRVTDEIDEDWAEDEPEDDPGPTIDDALEAVRSGEYITAPRAVGKVIGSQRIVKDDVAASPGGRPVWRCSCGRLATGWHAGHELEPVEQVNVGDVGDAYYADLADAAHATRLDKWLEWGPDEWRQIPEFPNYEINGYDRHVRRRAYTRTLKNGATRSYPEREVKARKSSVTLSHDGVVSSRGIEKLWKLTFPEYVVDPNSWQVHTLRHDNIPAELGRIIESRR